MTDPPIATSSTQEDLGGGFLFLQRPGGQSIIVATSLSDCGAVGIMTPASVNARGDGALRSWLIAWGYPKDSVLREVQQLHGNDVVPAALLSEGRAVGADGIWTNSRRDMLVVRSADCAALWLVEPQARLLGMAHAGWRGVDAGIIPSLVDALQHAGAAAVRMQVAVGPHIGPCCFEVGPEVAERFIDYAGAIQPADFLRGARKNRDSVALDLSAAIVADLQSSGIPLDSISMSKACTRCRDDVFHSYRRNGPGGPLMASLGALL